MSGADFPAYYGSSTFHAPGGACTFQSLYYWPEGSFNIPSSTSSFDHEGGDEASANPLTPSTNISQSSSDDSVEHYGFQVPSELPTTSYGAQEPYAAQGPTSRHPLNHAFDLTPTRGQGYPSRDNISPRGVSGYPPDASHIGLPFPGRHQPSVQIRTASHGPIPAHTSPYTSPTRYTAHFRSAPVTLAPEEVSIPSFPMPSEQQTEEEQIEGYLRRTIGLSPDTSVNLWALPDVPFDRKPEYRYVTLIALAIFGSERKMLTLQQIFDAIERRFPFYKTADKAWKNSIRHQLSLNKLFKNIVRPEAIQGRGGFWCLDLSEGAGPNRRRKRAEPRRRAERRGGGTAMASRDSTSTSSPGSSEFATEDDVEDDGPGPSRSTYERAFMRQGRRPSPLASPSPPTHVSDASEPNASPSPASEDATFHPMQIQAARGRPGSFGRPPFPSQSTYGGVAVPSGSRAHTPFGHPGIPGSSLMVPLGAGANPNVPAYPSPSGSSTTSGNEFEVGVGTPAEFRSRMGSTDDSQVLSLSRAGRERERKEIKN